MQLAGLFEDIMQLLAGLPFLPLHIGKGQSVPFHNTANQGHASEISADVFCKVRQQPQLDLYRPRGGFD
jgi:hypothetical protein